MMMGSYTLLPILKGPDEGIHTTGYLYMHKEEMLRNMCVQMCACTYHIMRTLALLGNGMY
mgnify:FL=1